MRDLRSFLRGDLAFAISTFFLFGLISFLACKLLNNEWALYVGMLVAPLYYVNFSKKDPNLQEQIRRYREQRDTSKRAKHEEELGKHL